MFTPGYYNGATPNGRWTFTQLDSTPGWEGQGADRFRYDVGATRVVNADAPGAALAGTVGTPDRLRPEPDRQAPGQLRLSRGPAVQRDPAVRLRLAVPALGHATLLDPMQISFDMTGGSSGGGWFLDSNVQRRGRRRRAAGLGQLLRLQRRKERDYGP